MIGRKKVLSAANGDISARVAFIAEAPGRLGADATGIPLFGDKTGQNFETLLKQTGWRRQDVFITNAVICNPRDERGNNTAPTSREISNCSPYLAMILELIQPEVVVTLGATALEALNNIRRHDYVLRRHVGKALPWDGRVLVPLYHPGPRALIHRSLAEHVSDFRSLTGFVHSGGACLGGELEGSRDEYSHDFQRLVFAIVHSLGPVTYFKLTKLLYLVDLNALDRLGRSLTGEIYLRQEEGPWPPALPKMIEPLKGREISVSYRGRVAVVEPGPSPRLDIDFGNEELEVIAAVLQRYGKLDNAGIKIAVYRTPPMRYILTQEKRGRNMRNVPVIYKDTVAPVTDPAAPMPDEAATVRF
jgi:uracil-DNA glycosylase family 4